MGSVMMLTPEQVLEAIRDEFLRLRNDITRVAPKGDEGSLKATVSSMEDSEVSSVIERIMDMYDTIARHEKPF
jgi:hypothetical protein